MKHVDIVSKIVGRENAGKPAGELLPSMGIYALKRELSSLRSLFNDFLEGDDTDDVINRWKDLEAFLNGISEDNTLSSILGNYIPIQGYTDILGEKNFVNGLNIGGIKLYKSDEGVIYIDGNLAVTGGFTMYADDGSVNIPTIAEGLPFDNRTIWFNPETNQIEVIGGTGGGGGEGVSNFWDLSGIPSWITNTKPTYDYSEIEDTPDLSKYALVSQIPSLDGYATQTWVKNQGYLTEHQDLSGYQPLITTSNKLPYSLISGTPTIPTALKNPYALTFGSKTYDGSEAKTITASDLGALTAHQTIYNLTMLAGTFTEVIFDPNGAAKTVNIPTTTSHISEGSNLYFTNARATGAITGGASTIATSNLTASRALISNSSGKVAVSAVTSTELGYLDGVTSAIQTQLNARVTLSGTQTITGEKDFTGGLKVNGSPIVYDATNKYWKLEGDLLVTGGVSMYSSDTEFTPSTIMDAITVDGVTLSKEDGVLKVIGGGSGITDITKEMVIGALGYTPYNATNPNGYITSYTDTKNTAGSTNSSSKLFLIGATSQAANPQTYSHDTAYVGTDGCLYSGGSKVLTAHQSIYALTIKNSAGTTQLTYTPNSGAGSITLTKAMVGLSNVENTTLSTWTGTSKITTLGTITTGTWNGTKIGNAYLANSAITISGTSVSLGGSITQSALRTALGLGSNAYTSTAYLPLSGGTLTGNLTLQYANPRIILKDAEGTTLGSFGLNNNALSYYKTADTKWYNIWHSGNFTPSNYLPLTGGTLSGQLILDHDYGSNSNIIFKNNRLSSTQTSNSADNVILINDSTNATVGRLGVYGITGVISYIHIGLNGYNGNNLRIYSDKVTFGDSQLAYLTSNVASATKLATARTIWGQSFDGTGNITGYLRMLNNTSMGWEDTNATYRNALYLSSNNNLRLGYGTSAAGYNTYIDGNEVSLTYGTSHTVGLALLSSGRISAKGNIDIPNNKAIYFKNSSNTDINSLYFDNSNILHLGYGTSGSYNTKIYGNNLYLHYGSRSVGMVLNNSGNVTIGSSDSASTTYKMYVSGKLATTEDIFLRTNAKYLRGVLSDGSETNIIGVNASDLLLVGYGQRLLGKATYYYGGLHAWYYGTAGNSAIGMQINTNGNVTIGASDLASTNYKLYVAGVMRTSNNIICQSTSNVVRHITVANDVGSTALYVATSGNRGLYDLNDNSWIIYTDGTNTISSTKTHIQRSNVIYHNNKILYWYQSDNATSMSTLYVNASNALVLGKGTAQVGGATYLDGNVIYFRYGKSNTTGMYLSSSGNFGIGTTSPSAKLHVAGDILATGGITMQSARKLKNVTDERGLSLEELRAIKPTRFTWKDGRDNKIHIGGIADDVMKVLPEVIYKTTDDTLTMDYGNAAFAISASLIKPVIDHEERIKMLEEENKQLKEEIEILKWNIA